MNGAIECYRTLTKGVPGSVKVEMKAKDIRAMIADSDEARGALIADLQAFQEYSAAQRATIARLQAERDRLAASRDRLFFEVQILQMTQGALKMEIERLRGQPTISAVDATVTVSHDGITISAPMVSVSGGDVTVTA